MTISASSTVPRPTGFSVGTVDLIVIPQQIPRRAIEWECFHDLLCRPFGSGTRGHVEMKNASSIVGEYDENIENVERNGRYGEKVD